MTAILIAIIIALFILCAVLGCAAMIYRKRMLQWKDGYHELDEELDRE